jgi:hypothetical protein
MTEKLRFGKDLEGSGRYLVEVLSDHLPERTQRRNTAVKIAGVLVEV